MASKNGKGPVALLPTDEVQQEPGPENASAAPPDGMFRSDFNQAAVNQRLASRVGALTLQLEQVTQALQESREREAEAKSIIDGLMSALEEARNGS